MFSLCFSSKYFIISLLIFLAQCILVICYSISRCEVFSYSFVAYIWFYYIKARKYSLCIPRNVSVLLSVFSLSASLYLRVSPVDTQKHVCLFVLLPPGHSASATGKSLGWEGHVGVGTDPAAPHLCCDLYPDACHFWASLSCSEQWGSQRPSWGACRTHVNSWRCLAHEKAQQCWVRSDSEVPFQKGTWPIQTQGFITSLPAFFSPLCMACRILIR